MPTQFPDLYDEHGQPEDNLRRLPLYCAVSYLLHEQFPLADVSALVDVPKPDFQRPGAPVSMQVKILPEAFATSKLNEKTRLLVLGVFGGMLMANMDDPALGRPPEAMRSQNEIIVDVPFVWTDEFGAQVEQLRVRIMPRFVEVFTRAVQNFTVNQRMFEMVYTYLQQVGRSPLNGKDAVSNVFAEQIAKVVARLVEQKVSPDAPQLRLHIQSCVDQTVASACATSCGTGGRYSNIDLDLPDLAGEMSAEIYPENVRAQSVLYFASQLEDMRLFSVADEVAHQFAMGLLPITRGAAGDNLFEYIKGAPNRFTEAERRGFYARGFGFTNGGADTSDPNREFSNLWIRALSAVSTFNRQNASSYVDPDPSGFPRPQPMVFNVDQRRLPMMQVFKSTRDLSINLSLHGFAMAHYSAVELQQTIMQIRNMLSHPDVLSAFGVRDYFQLIERVSRMYMNSDVNTMRQRVMAQSGSRIIQWLADRSEVLASPNMPSSSMFMDPELNANVERWLAVTGTAGTVIDQYSEPVATPAQSTIPSLQFMRGAMRSVEHSLNSLEHAASAPAPSTVAPAEA